MIIQLDNLTQEVFLNQFSEHYPWNSLRHSYSLGICCRQSDKWQNVGQNNVFKGVYVSVTSIYAVRAQHIFGQVSKVTETLGISYKGHIFDP